MVSWGLVLFMVVEATLGVGLDLLERWSLFMLDAVGAWFASWWLPFWSWICADDRWSGFVGSFIASVLSLGSALLIFWLSTSVQTKKAASELKRQAELRLEDVARIDRNRRRDLIARYLGAVAQFRPSISFGAAAAEEQIAIATSTSIALRFEGMGEDFDEGLEIVTTQLSKFVDVAIKLRDGLNARRLFLRTPGRMTPESLFNMVKIKLDSASRELRQQFVAFELESNEVSNQALAQWLKERGNLLASQFRELQENDANFAAMYPLV